ncbi:MAG: RidA family protein [Armatimonas sp.]
MNITHVNPDSMYKNPAFSQLVVLEGPAKLVFVGGQNGVLPDGSIAGDDVAAQSKQALRNLIEALAAVGAKQENVLKLTIILKQGEDMAEAYKPTQEIWGAHPTAVTGMVVAGLANPKALIEIEAIAAIEP